MTVHRNIFDLIILGATPAGIAAAVAAARRGYTSLILERTAHIGGLPANGLGATDIATRACGGGFFKEFIDRIKQYYIETYGPQSVQVAHCDDGYKFEPHVAERVFHDFIQACHPNVIVLRKRQFDFEPDNLEIVHSSIRSIRVTDLINKREECYSGRFFCDCSYEGDIIAASAGVSCFLGREGKEIYDEPGAGRVYKLWNGPECSGSTNVGDNAVQAFNYRLCLTAKASNRAKFQQPKNYNRKEFLSLIDDVKSGIHTGAQNRLSPPQLEQNRRRAERGERPIPHLLKGIARLCSNNRVPNDKVDANNQHLALISTDLPEENWPYSTSGWAWRDSFAERLRDYTEGLLYFAQNDEELPEWFRSEISEWGWAADEYTDNGYFPRQMYVREGRRMKGKYVFTAHDALPGEDGRAPLHKDSITASHYALDSHAVRKREPGRVHLDGFLSYKCVPYTVPYGVIVPDSPIKNLLAPVPVSASHIGFSTLRMEPCWMAMGQAAGIAACIALLDGCSAADVDIGALQDALLEEGAVLWI
ncbi:hypothetical protein NA57DRAFT_57183 [Rhizodiscina lignyota]|uniref:FAD-dependent oxidoreductase n=1 Tax=Rhizodiscina lignyota TaxID=1504668 RepID=A0A9P4IDH4_9PEZI|nr:hypothetical protein NA57DRAFT_57183 [Rhizodiscina lignyota]